MAMRSQTVRAFPYGVVLLLTACGGGGGNGGSSSGGAGGGGSTVTGTGFAPSTGPGDTAGYFPVASGDQWQFNYSTTDPKAVAPTAVVTVSVNGTKSVLGTTATVLTQTNPTIATGGYDQYVSVSPGGVTDLGNSNAGDTITPLIVPYVQMLFPVQLGTVSMVTGQNLPAGKDPSGNAITLNMTQIIANASMETVDVPAGSYAGALKQVTTVTGAAHDNGQSLAVSGTDTAWFVAGIGEVKETISSASGGVMISSSAELRAAIVNGQTHGLGAARDLVAVSPAMASIYAPTLPVIASDGTNFRIVTLRASVSGGAWQQNWQGTLVAADGTVLSSFNITAPVSTTLSCGGGLFAVAGFDGTNYLVVTENSHCATLQPTTLDAVVISPAGAIVAFDGTNYLVTYRDPRGQSSTFNATVSAARISKAGVLLDGTLAAAGIVVTSAPGVPLGRVASVFRDGAHWIVWESGGPNALSASRVSPAGIVPSAWQNGFPLVPATGEVSSPAIAAGSSAGYVTWLHGQGTSPEITSLAGLAVFP